MESVVRPNERPAEDLAGEQPTASSRGRRRTTSLSAWWSGAWRPLLALVALVIGWWGLSASGVIAPYLLPSPGETWKAIVDNAGYLWSNTLTTAWETLIAFGISVAFGLFCGVVMVYSRPVEKTLYPLLVLAQVVPKIALAPLFVVWLGYGLSPKILVAFLIAFFPVVVSSFVGLRSIDPEILDLAATMDASRVQTFFRFRFPASLPHLFSGLKVAVTLAVTGAIVGEFVGSNKGLGSVILEANGNVNTALLFAALVVLSLLGVILFLLVDIVERVAMPWDYSRRVDSAATTQ